jgi:hypothetical protein
MTSWILASVLSLAPAAVLAQVPVRESPNPYFIKKVAPEDKLARYLTRDGRLTAPLTVRDEERGFGVFWGTVWTVNQDGSWTSSRIERNIPYARGQGKLTADELKKLAKVLAEADPLTLPNVGQPVVNPHVVTVSFGPQTASLTFGVDQKLTPVNPAQPAPDFIGRFSAVQSAVRSLIEPRLGPEPPLPRRLK